MRKKKQTAQISSRNATTHGMRQEYFSLLPHESPVEFAAMAKRWRDEYSKLTPSHPALEQLITHVIERDWMQTRCLRHVDTLQAELMEAQIRNDVSMEERLERRLLNAFRYKTASENAFTRAKKSLEDFRHTRIKEKQAWERLDIQRFKVVQRVAIDHFDRDIPENRPDPEVPPVFTKDLVDDREEDNEETESTDSSPQTQQHRPNHHEQADEKRLAQRNGALQEREETSEEERESRREKS